MDYLGLKDLATRFADRQDEEIAVLYPQYLAMAEARINRVLKTREQSTRAYTPTVKDTRYYSLPPDYRGMRDVQMTHQTPQDPRLTTRPMFYISPQKYNEIENSHVDGKLYYTVIANQIQILPAVDAGFTIEMVYYQKVPPLTETEPTNWMSADHPDIYIAALTGEISMFVKDYDAADKWFSRLNVAINELEVSDIKERWTGGDLTTRIEP